MLIHLNSSILKINQTKCWGDVGLKTHPFLYLIILQFFYTGIKAQTCDTSSKEFRGAVIKRAEQKKDSIGKIQYGCINLLGWQEMIVAPMLTDSIGYSKRYFGRETLAYWYIRNNDTVYYLNAGKNLSHIRWIFLERLVGGPLELYYFKAQGTSLLTLSKNEYRYYYFRKDGIWLNKKEIVWNESGKRKQLEKIFSNCPDALALISKTSDLQLDEILIELTLLYNSSACNLR